MKKVFVKTKNVKNFITMMITYSKGLMGFQGWGFCMANPGLEKLKP